MSSGNTTLYLYDGLGDQTEAIDGLDITTYGYNQTAQLTSASTGLLGTATDYTYDGNGLEAAATTGSNVSQLTWDNNASLPEILSDGVNDYIYGPTTTPVEQINLTTSTPTYMTYTSSDSSWLTTNQTGDETGFWRYDAFGNLAYGTPTTDFGYSGQYADSTTGLVNDRARWYEPETGVFTSRDPAFPATDSAYTYANDNPVSHVDPKGLETICGLPGFNRNSRSVFDLQIIQGIGPLRES